MKKRKRIRALFMAVLFMMAFLAGIADINNRKVSEVKAAGNGVEAKIANVLNKFPDGSYFSSTGGPCGPGQTDFGAGNYCTYCQLYVMDRAACSVCGNGDSCNAFAKYVFYNVFGLNPRSCPSVECDNPNNAAKIGDFLTCYDANGKEVHYSIYMGSAGGNSFYAYEANVGTENLVRYKFLHTAKYGNLWPKYRVYHASNYDQMDDVSYKPESSLDSVTSEYGCVRMTGWSFDRDSLSSAIMIHVYMDDMIAGSWAADKKRTDVNDVYGCGEYHGFDFTIPITSSGTHTFKVFAINIDKDGQVSGQENPLIGSKTVYVDADETPPVISDVKIIAKDSLGYTIECKVTDNYKVDRVQCPTWTVANGQDDIQEAWWVDPSVKATDMGDGIYQFRVNISDHLYEYGLYRTHIYAYDVSGNYASSIVEDIEVFEDRLQYFENFGSTMNGRDARVLEFDVVAREGDEGSELTITTSTNVNGKDIIKNESFTIEKTGRIRYYHLVDRSNYNNGDGDYTTTAVLKDKDGEILESKEMIYNFANYAGPYYISLNVGDEVNVFEEAGIAADIKGALKFKYWLWPDYCNICTGEIECISDDVYKGKTAGRVYACFLNFSSAERTTVIIDVVDSKTDASTTVQTPEPSVTEQPNQPATEPPATELPTTEPPRQPVTEPPATEQPNQPATEPPRQPVTEPPATGQPGQSVSTSKLKVKAFKAKAGKKKLSLSWNRNIEADGYQIQVSTKKNFAGAKKKSLSWIKDSCSFKNLKAKKKYYIRIRAYVNGQSKKVYGKWIVISKKTK